MKKFVILTFHIAIIAYAACCMADTNHLQLEKQLSECLEVCWGIDRHTIKFIKTQFTPLLEDKSHHATVQEFIEISKKQNIDFSSPKKMKALPKEDGVLQSPEEHLVVFENPFIRVLLGSTNPGKRESLHLHQWKSVMVTLHPTVYEMEFANGKKEKLDCPIAVIELPAGEKYACTNIGSTADKSLRFEIKN